MEAYTAEFRAEVLAACDAAADTKVGTKAIALRFNVSESWVRSIKQQRRETGKIAPQTAARRLPKWHAWAGWLLAKIADRPDIYLRELQDELKTELNEEVCLATLCNACSELDQSRKKRH
jgi:transposase